MRVRKFSHRQENSFSQAGEYHDMLFPVIIVPIGVKHRFGCNPIRPEYVFNKHLFFRGNGPFAVPHPIIRTPSEVAINRTFDGSCIPVSQIIIQMRHADSETHQSLFPEKRTGLPIRTHLIRIHDSNIIPIRRNQGGQHMAKTFAGTRTLPVKTMSIIIRR